MPAWDVDDRLTEDPQNEISLIYYDNRGGIEDRVFRIKTDRSSATSLPEPRTGHNITDIEIMEHDGDQVKVRFNWFTLYFRYNTTDTYFGTSFYTIDLCRRRAGNHEEEGRPEERLHPPRGGRLHDLTARRRCPAFARHRPRPFQNPCPPGTSALSRVATTRPPARRKSWATK